MTIQYPSNLDTFTPLTPGVGGSRQSDSVGGRTHAQLHNDATSAILALEAKVGITGSAVTTTLDYKTSGIVGTDKAASLGGTETLSGKTLATPTIASFINANHTHVDGPNGGQLTDAALSSAVTVPKGGTGKTSLTAYALLAGGTTSTGAVQSLAALGASGTVLTSNGPSALPTFQSAVTAVLSTSGISSGPSASTTQTIAHGLGKVPTIIRVSSLSFLNASGLTTNASGIYDSSGNRCIYTIYSGGIPSGVTNSTTFAVYVYNSATALASGVIQNATSTNFDIVWTTTGNPSAGTNFLWEAQ